MNLEPQKKVSKPNGGGKCGLAVGSGWFVFAGSWLAGKVFEPPRSPSIESQARGKAPEVEQYATATLAGIDFVEDDGVLPALTRLAEGRGLLRSLRRSTFCNARIERGESPSSRALSRN